MQICQYTTISIIIPCLNEAECIGQTLDYVLEQATGDYEIIIVDGGSTDNTVAVVSTYPAVQLLHAPVQSRAAQMNLGAQKSNGDILYFLHADSLPPKNYMSIIRNHVNNGIDLGNFSVQFSPTSAIFKINEWVTRQPTLYQGGGDQSLYIKSDVFDSLGGYDEYYIIMEEYEFLRRAKKKYNFKLDTRYFVITSSRKYVQNTYIKTQFVHGIIMLLYQFNVSPIKLKTIYNKWLKTH